MSGHKKWEIGIGWVIFALLTLPAGVMGKESVSSAELQSRAQDRLFHAGLAETVSVRIEDRHATLTGKAESLGLKTKAEREVERVDGITSIANEIRIEAPGATDASVLEKAAREVRTYPYYTIFDDIRLEAKGGTLQISGSVLQPWRRNEIGTILAFVPGVRQIVNDLEVLPVSFMDDQIRMKVARAIYGDTVLSRYGIQANPPIHIIVKNGNVTLTGVVNSPVEKAAAERAARFAAVFFGLANNLEVET